MTRPGAQRAVLVAHPGAELYGSDRVLLDSVSALVDAGYRTTVVVSGAGPLIGELTAAGAAVTTCRMPVLRKSALRPRGFLRLLWDSLAGLPPAIRLIRSAGTDGVYVNTVTIPSWLLLARLLRRPTLCHVHEAERSASRVVRRLMTLPVLAARVVVVNSAFSRDLLVEDWPALAARSTVVDNGVRGPAEVRPARDALDGGVRLLYIGRLSPRKGPQVAIAAARLLADRGVAFRLELLGSVFPGYEWFEQRLRDDVTGAGLTDAVSFAGFDPDIWPHLQVTDLVLVPSTVDEPFGNTAVEAMLAARPLVVSATSGLLEAAAGYASAQAVPPDDPVAVADAVQGAVADWPRMRTAALADAAAAADRHSVRRYGSRIVDAVRRAQRRAA